MDQKQQEKRKTLEKIKELLDKELLEEGRFLLSFHYVEGEQLRNFLFTNDFPTGDLGPALKFLDEESLKILKRGSSGNGRRQS